MTLRDYAIAAAERGWRVFPIVPGETRPLVKFSKESSRDPEHVARVWRTERSRKNIGIHTGEGLVVVDIDAQSGGVEGWTELCHEHNDGYGPGETYCVQTPSGGVHMYFTTDADVRNSASKIAPGVDIRGHNGYVVGAGSVRAATDKKPGGEYVVIDDRDPIPMPEWLEALVMAETRPQTASAPASDDEPLEDVPAGARNDRLFKEACGLRGKGWKHDAILAAITSRNATFTEPLGEDEVALIVSQASKYSPNAPSLHDAVYKPTKKRKRRHPDEPDQDEDERRTLDVRKLSTYTRRKVHFLWRGMFPLSSVSIIAGDPGQAKTSFMLNIAAAITKGSSPLKGGPGTPKGSVMFATAEDSIDHTIYPRVHAAGGDDDKFYVVQTPDFSVIDDYDAMCTVLDQIGDVRLLIVDPITAYMHREADGNSNTDVRVMLRSLTDLAAEYDMAIVGISHLNKDTRKSVFARLLGSVGWVAAPRAVYLVNENPDQPGQSVVACAKTNFEEPEPVAFRKQIIDVDTSEGMASQVVTLLEEFTGDIGIDELFAARDKKVSKVEQARRWLRDRLSMGEWVAVADLQHEVEHSQPFSWRTLKAAEAKLVVEKKKDPPPGGWSWRMEPAIANVSDDKILSHVRD